MTVDHRRTHVAAEARLGEEALRAARELVKLGLLNAQAIGFG